MTMKNNAKIEKKMTCQFEINMRNLTNFDPSTQKYQKNLHFNRLILTKVRMFELKKYRGAMFDCTQD